jgi:hypothetical protein
METNIHFQSYLPQLFLEQEMFPSYIENQNVHLKFNNLFFENCGVYEIMWKNIVEPDRPHDNTAHVHIMLDN